ncbi:hypothetical protein KIN20_025360 [Parelaphostrongylus tenuis]|uniref:Uncharacterized protein n=1 Tax=Parelaphostrongylus tenuis TaxID=148309 RepID=A0AAD5MZF3_PARTN|nr:hypothetical protein KIN20_025360 [Parelaphostrongylus tenuis]
MIYVFKGRFGCFRGCLGVALGHANAYITSNLAQTYSRKEIITFYTRSAPYSLLLRIPVMTHQLEFNDFNSIFDVRKCQARSALLPDAIIMAILSELTVSVTYEPVECQAVAITLMKTANGSAARKTFLGNDTVKTWKRLFGPRPFSIGRMANESEYRIENLVYEKETKMARRMRKSTIYSPAKESACSTQSLFCTGSDHCLLPITADQKHNLAVSWKLIHVIDQEEIVKQLPQEHFRQILSNHDCRLRMILPKTTSCLSNYLKCAPSQPNLLNPEKPIAFPPPRRSC